jgi:hypothetical protein
MNKYEEMELEILRKAVDESQKRIGKKSAQSPEIQEIIKIVEMFLRKKRLICYGGIAINNILPSDDQFYDRETEIPDYDFFSANAMEDAKELSDIFYSKGYKEVEAKTAQHIGTFKVFVNFIGVADITDVPKALFEIIQKDSMVVEGIHYVSANFLRMGIYKELSNPEGDSSRFEKIYKRLLLLNKYYPITDLNCNTVEYRREMSDESNKEKIYQILLQTFANYGCVFFGGHALSVYSEYMPENIKGKFKDLNPDFDVLSTNPDEVLRALKREFKAHQIPMRFVVHEAFGEIVPKSYEIIVRKDTVGFIYQTDQCYSYNELIVKGRKVKIATIDTMLFMYFAFLYANNPALYDHTRIICMCNFLFNVQQKNKLSQKGVLKRFSTTCYGHQEQREEMKLKRSELYKRLKNRPEDREYQYSFFNYKPDGNRPEGARESKRNRVYPKRNFERSEPFSSQSTPAMKTKTLQRRPRGRFSFFSNIEKTQRNIEKRLKQANTRRFRKRRHNYVWNFHHRKTIKKPKLSYK